ncbi:hypothetical protein MSAN_00581500 [Mycena sanguinolenta]|uniref:Protein kinase domain-containing protein n=1 Tax=Mycena sanguinolenta TaxID=230812 RepID=A0A8H7DGP9_9AGAR|nr:hypothetical protein MSAN_00581500 [Mycena sanguinolenta]
MDPQPHSEPELDVVSTTRVTNLKSAVLAGAFFPHATGLTIDGGAFTSNVINNVYSWPQEQSSGISFLVIISLHGRPKVEIQRIRLSGYTGSFFPNATAFTINGGVFTCNVTNNVYDEQFPEFRRIPLGDIKLGKEFKNVVCSGILDRQNRVAGVRRIYSAKICPNPAPVTVAMYQGRAAEEEWHQHLAKYKAIRHPNVMQLYGLVRSPSVHAMVFYNEMIPYWQFLTSFQHSPILYTYFIGYCTTEFDEAINYLSYVFRKPLIDYDNLLVWIRPETGEVCLDLVQGPGMAFKHPWWKVDVLRLENVSLDKPDAEAEVISSLSEDSYHQLCSMPSIAQYRTFTVSTQLRRYPGFQQLLTWDLYIGGIMEFKKEKSFPIPGEGLPKIQSPAVPAANYPRRVGTSPKLPPVPHQSFTTAPASATNARSIAAQVCSRSMSLAKAQAVASSARCRTFKFCYIAT